ncbi:MAG: nucleotidyltransferase domain-containing protein [Candidatus Riflebacteria bacterium]|nr:nucleotidyltransferase domain-containing protein [Candidatus Riflebacteria bacterium]
MRVAKAVLDFFRAWAKEIAPEARLFLFGSRNDDSRKGGDIDILVLTARRLPARVLRQARIRFRKTFGEQRIDLVNFTLADPSPFKKLAILEGTEFS